MNKFIYSNIKISPIYGLSMLRKHINKGITELSVENIFNRYKEIELEKKKFVSSKKSNKDIQTIIKLRDEIVNTNKFQLKKKKLNEKNIILMKEQPYIGLISPFNSKLANYTNHIYTFTNKPYKQINKNLFNLYTICKSAFLNMSSIISKPIVSFNPNLLKITIFYY